MKVNVYDFDKTVYLKDSSVQFLLFCYKKNILLIRFIFVQIWYCFLYVFNFIEKTKFKQGFFSFLKGIKNIDVYVEQFWKKNEKFINPFYLTQKKDNDIIISASPFFLIYPLCQRLGIKQIIASDVDKRTGKFLSENCYGEEKKKRFLLKYPDLTINNFYSDSLSDKPLAELASQAYIVEGNKLVLWEEYSSSEKAKKRNPFMSKEFIAFLIVGVINAINGVLLASLFSLFLNPNLAFIIGYIVSLTISYFLNSILAFREKLAIIKYLKFCLSYVPNFLIQNGLVLLFYNVLGVNKFLVYVIAVVIAVPVTFLLIKIFAFGKKKSNK